MGDAAAYRMTVERSEVIEAIDALGGEAKVSEVASIISKSPANTSYLLGKMTEAGAVRKVGHGVYALLTQPLEALESLNLIQGALPGTSRESRGLVDQGNTGKPGSGASTVNQDDLPDPW
jgi:DNA-binding transcriptional ArsR family regulator